MGQLTRNQALLNLGEEEIANRNEGLKLWQAHNDAYLAHDAAKDAVESQFEAKREAAEQQIAAIRKALYSAIDEHPDVAPSAAALEAAERAWQDYPGIDSDLMSDIDDDGMPHPRLCAISGVVVAENDAILEDPNTGEIVLKRALGIRLLDDGTFDPDAINA